MKIVCFRMGMLQHCPSYTFDRHLCRVHTLADVVFGISCLGAWYPPRKVSKDVMHATFTMGLHWAYKIHVQKDQNAPTVAPPAYIESPR